MNHTLKILLMTELYKWKKISYPRINFFLSSITAFPKSWSCHSPCFRSWFGFLVFHKRKRQLITPKNKQENMSFQEKKNPPTIYFISCYLQCQVEQSGTSANLASVTKRAWLEEIRSERLLWPHRRDMSTGQPGNEQVKQAVFPSIPFLVGPVEDISLLTAKPLVVTENEELSLWLDVDLQLWGHKFSFLSKSYFSQQRPC